MTLEEIKLRRLAHQHLLSPCDTRTAVRDLLGVQAQFMSYARHSLRIRCRDFSEAAVRDQLVKSWTIRGTLHVFDPEDLPLFLHQGRSHFLRPCDTLEGDDCITKERKQHFAALILEQLQNGVCERGALMEACLRDGMTEEEAKSVFDPWGGTLRALCEVGAICHRVGQKKEFQLCPPFSPMEKEEAELEQARRYFTHFAPATVKDAAYFFGVSQRQVKSWLERLPVSATECQGNTYYSIPGGVEPETDLPDCLFLSGFDQLMLGYEKKESLFLPPEHLRKIFSLSGIVMPPVLLRGTVVGKWKHSGKRLTVTLFEPLVPEDQKRIDAAAEELFPNTKLQFE